MSIDQLVDFTLDLICDAAPLATECPIGIDSLTSYALDTLHLQDRLTTDSIDKIEISVQCLAAKEMQALNSRYRQQDKATNVLSFESGMPQLVDEQGECFRVLGDIIFCPEVIAHEAKEQAKPAQWHWGHLMVHGTLHLCGYDHIDAQEAADMEALETKILSASGISNPYLIQTD